MSPPEWEFDILMIILEDLYVHAKDVQQTNKKNQPISVEWF
jgi:hypothetical protein